MLARMPAKMNRAPPMVSSHPMVLLPFQKRIPIPNSIGKSVMPKLLPPQKLQYEPTTLTRCVMRNPPIHAMAKPTRNWPSPPEVPPTSLIERFSMNGRIAPRVVSGNGVLPSLSLCAESSNKRRGTDGLVYRAAGFSVLPLGLSRNGLGGDQCRSPRRGLLASGVGSPSWRITSVLPVIRPIAMKRRH